MVYEARMDGFRTQDKTPDKDLLEANNLNYLSRIFVSSSAPLVNKLSLYRCDMRSQSSSISDFEALLKRNGHSAEKATESEAIRKAQNARNILSFISAEVLKTQKIQNTDRVTVSVTLRNLRFVPTATAPGKKLRREMGVELHLKKIAPTPPHLPQNHWNLEQEIGGRLVTCCLLLL